MFTGIVEAPGRVVGLARREGGAVLTLDRPEAWTDLATGESVSVSGVCLTVLPPGGGRTVAFDLSSETLRRSTLGGLSPGARVNLERAMRADGRFGGHIVAGHVDAASRVEAVLPSGEFWTLRFSLDAAFSRYVVEKGSVAVDGVSLTVAALGERTFDVAVIPHTLSSTTLGERRPGDRVNVEVDVLGKYVERLLAARSPRGEGGSDDRLLGLLSTGG
ncbi:riboflavin synthase [Acidobacteria bacterium ACD]|nr:riboflavin synthase [Acidobacteria bacterium ACD]